MCKRLMCNVIWSIGISVLYGCSFSRKLFDEMLLGCLLGRISFMWPSCVYVCVHVSTSLHTLLDMLSNAVFCEDVVVASFGGHF